MRALTDDASLLLEELLSHGAEIPFEVGEAGDPPGARGSVTMFAYRPLTSEFVASHADQLRRLPTFEAAAQNLARTRGVIAYLRVRNEPVLDVGELTHARLCVLAFLSAVWQNAERFEHWSDRFERAYTELESVTLAERLVTTVFIPMHGVALTEGRVNLGAGAEIIALEELDPTCADRFSDSVTGIDAVCSVSVTAPSDAPTPMPAVRLSARAVLTGLRLFRPGSVAMATTAQADTGGAWHQVAMPFSGRSREEAWTLTPGDEEELRQFVNAVRRVERRTRISWALKRFETGLEKTVPADGLTDFLLALRALLEAEDDRGKSALPARVSALCAQDHERARVREEIEAAFALERLAIDGRVGRADRKRLEKLVPLEVIAASERHLRALLHDLVCGYLSSDLRALADEILTADGEPAGEESVAADPVYLEPVPDPGAEPTPDPTQTVEFEAVFDDTAEIKAVDLREDVAAFNEPSDAQPAADSADNVWTLRPAEQVAPAPEVTAEPEPIRPPEWEVAPERRPVPTRRPHESMQRDAGFTFDFEGLDEAVRPPAAAPADSDFPVREFGVELGRGPAARRSDAEVDGREQHASFRQIMDEASAHPARAGDEAATTPLGREQGAHLVAVEGVEPESEPRIVPPSAPEEGDAVAERDPELTVEYDVLGAEPSAEEAAQLAWSRQFLRREDEAPTPAQPLRPAGDLVLAKFSEPVDQVEPEAHAGDEDRNHRIGPSTVEFRPVVDADPDDPDDFCGGV